MATVQVTANLPGFLKEVIERRATAMTYKGKSEYVVGLILWDVYTRQPHEFTGALMHQPSWLMDKFVRGLAIDLGEPSLPAGEIIAYRFNTYVPEVLMPMVKDRAKETGYSSASAYIVALVIYDLTKRESAKKVAHHKAAAVMALKPSNRMLFYAQLHLGFGNDTRTWPLVAEPPKSKRQPTATPS